MRDYEDFQRILELWEAGTNKKRISIITGIPRATVRDCIIRYGDLQGLEENIARATLSTSKYVFEKICNPSQVQLQQAYAYVLGIYLGDGNLSKVRKVYRLRISLDARYPGIIQTCSQAIQTLLPDNQVGIVEIFNGDHLSLVDVSCYYKFWPDLLPQHGAGRKHERPIILEPWQQEIVDRYPLEFFRGLYHSDGSRSRNIVNGKDYPRYSFTNTSDDIRKLFCLACDKLNIHWTAKARYGQEYDIFISKRKDVEYLDSVVGPKL